MLFGVVDQRREISLFLCRQRVGEERVNFAPDGTGTILQDMAERFVFTMNIGEKMLGAFGQVELCAQPDKGYRGCLNRGVLPRQKLQITHLTCRYLLHRTIPCGPTDREVIIEPYS